MNLIDFDIHFTGYLNDWIEANRARFKRTEDMEHEVPDVYIRFLNTPQEWLQGATPGTYFDRWSDAAQLCQMLKDYIANAIPMPDPLLDRIVDLGDEQTVLTLVSDKSAALEARMHAIDLLRQMDSSLPMVEYIRWQVIRDEHEDLLDNALESLRGMGSGVRGAAKIAFTAADLEGKEALLDVLCDYPGDADVFCFALEQFKKQDDKRALFASYLAKLDDDHALEALYEAAESEDITYIDFIEVRSAIERLGGDMPYRDFSNDPTFIATRQLQ
ncbi:MAG: hypothetical protein GX096_15205 [Clostridiales bacterium]|nr:hypothetical protein [Clostridiales bacterium]